MGSLKTLKIFCSSLAAAVFILSGCGGSGSSSATSGPPGAPAPDSQGTATLTWTAPTSNSDGSALTNLAGYHIYYGDSAGSLRNMIDITSPGTLTYVVSNLGIGTWYFAVAAYTNTGLESSLSNVGSKTIN